MPDRHEYLPVKVVIQSNDDLFPPRAGGSRTDFTAGFPESRDAIDEGLSRVESYFSEHYANSSVPAVAQFYLREEALAKSHFPTSLFDTSSCAVIGRGNFDQIYVRLSTSGIARIRSELRKPSTKDLKNDISKIRSIEPYHVENVTHGLGSGEVLEQAQQHDARYFKLRLFDYGESRLNSALRRELNELVSLLEVDDVSEVHYSSQLNIVRVPANLEERQVIQLSRFVGLQSLTVMPRYGVSLQSCPVADIDGDHLPDPEYESEYPVVGLFDSGTDPNNVLLQNWVDGKDNSFVPIEDQDFDHGSLVAGLIVHPRSLNHNDPRFPSGHVKVLDVAVFPSQGYLDEFELIDAISVSLQRYPHVKVWNLSINSLGPCDADHVSDFAVALDELQERHGVLIVCSVGNLTECPYPRWPRDNQNQTHRICPPADSFLGLSVGSIAHLEHATSGSRVTEPSPFTRHGPAAGCVPKPDLCHFGGNSTLTGSFSQLGIRSVNGEGKIAETAGTSFSTALVSSLAGELTHALTEAPASHVLKAMLIHSAVLKSPEYSANECQFYGFGCPASVEDIVSCHPWEVTLIFDLDLPYGQRNYIKSDFPFPACLTRDEKAFGEILMTCVTAPQLDANGGASYCQVNVDPSLGMCVREDEGDVYKGRTVVPYPRDQVDLFEKSQLEHGFKWSPVKVFRANLKRKKALDFWRISLTAYARNQDNLPHTIPVCLIVTLRDPDRQQPVYNEAIQLMLRSGWVTESISLREDLRVSLEN